MPPLAVELCQNMSNKLQNGSKCLPRTPRVFWYLTPRFFWIGSQSGWQFKLTVKCKTSLFFFTHSEKKLCFSCKKLGFSYLFFFQLSVNVCQCLLVSWNILYAWITEKGKGIERDREMGCNISCFEQLLFITTSKCPQMMYNRQWSILICCLLRLLYKSLNNFPTNIFLNDDEIPYFSYTPHNCFQKFT